MFLDFILFVMNPVPLSTVSEYTVIFSIESVFRQGLVKIPQRGYVYIQKMLGSIALDSSFLSFSSKTGEDKHPKVYIKIMVGAN